MNRITAYDEEYILSKVAQGDETAFSTLFYQWHQLFANFIYRITENKQLTEDIVQEVFLKIWLTRESLPEIKNFKNYLLIICRNQAFNALKKNLRQSKREAIWEDSNLTGAENNEDAALFSLVDQAIESLPPRRKEVWKLNRFEKLTYKEIAALLHISKETVKTHVELANKSITSFIKSQVLNILLFIIDLF